MKYTIILLTLIIFSGCKKEAKDRYLEVWGDNAPSFSCKMRGDRHGTTGSGSIGTPFKYTMVEYENPHKLIVQADTSIFSCKVIVDGKVVYHKDGKYHELNF